jgi:uncharacterized protein (TIGR02186 family)
MHDAGAILRSWVIAALLLCSVASAQTDDVAPAETPLSEPGASSTQGQDAPPLEGPELLELPAALAEEQVTVAGGYSGFYMTLFGVNPDRRGRGDMVVVLRGPTEQADIFRWERTHWGVWEQGQRVRFDNVPSYQAVLTTRPLRQIAQAPSIVRFELDPVASARLQSEIPVGADASVYRLALRDIHQREGRYIEYVGPPSFANQGGLSLYQGGLFRGRVRVPANSPYATYHVDTYLFREGRAIATQSAPTMVSRVGFLRRVHELSTSYEIVAYSLVAALALLYWFALGLAARFVLGERIGFRRRASIS